MNWYLWLVVPVVLVVLGAVALGWGLFKDRRREQEFCEDARRRFPVGD
jgi:cytochrome c-type biogenesis protein CcmH/NrfF